MLDFFLSFLLIYEQAVLFGVAFLASFGLPLPITALLAAAGALAAQGYLNIWGVLGYGLLGCVLGDSLGYLVAQRCGKAIFLKIGLRKMLASASFEHISVKFRKHSSASIFYSRFLVTVIAPVINILAGLENLPYGRYAWYVTTGQLLHVVIFWLLGYLLSDQWENISALSEEIGTIVVLIALLLSLIFVLFHRHSLDKKR